MHALKKLLFTSALVLSCSAHAAKGLTESKFASDLAQLKKDVQAQGTRAEALAVIQKYSKALDAQAREQRAIAKNDAYYRATEMSVRMDTILGSNCDDMEADLEFRDTSMADGEDVEPSPDLKKATELARIICNKK